MGFLIKYLIMETLKVALYNHCESFLRQKANNYLAQDQSLLKALESEAKSSAGDKHETARAMIQLEREKLAQLRQLNEQQRNTLAVLKSKKPFVVIALGALVNTTLGFYYLGVPANTFFYQDPQSTAVTPIYCISPQSPIGQLLLGKKEGDQVVFRDKKIKILTVG